MKPKVSKFWVLLLLATPVLYFTFQFLPYYHAGGGALPSLAGYFWSPETNEQTTAFLALFYADFRANDLITALLGTQFFAIIIIIMTLILKNRCIVAISLGIWGLFGLYIFLTTRSLTFSPVLVYSGIASLLMLFTFLLAVAISVVYNLRIYAEYKKNILILKAEQVEQAA